MHPSVYKRPLFLLLVALVVCLAFFYHPEPDLRDVSHHISTESITLVGQIESFAIAKNNSHNAWMKVSLLNGQPTRGKVYARFADFNPAWKDTLVVTGRLQKPYGIDSPGNFNWQRYLAYKQTFAEIKVDSVSVLRPASWPWRFVRYLRQEMLQTFEKAFPSSLAGIAGGVLLGERGTLSNDLYAAFQRSGAIHLLVASGGNVGFVTLMTLGIGFLFGLRRRTLLIVALVTAGIYTLIAGADAPLLRAYLMAIGACVGYFLGRNSGVFQGWVLAGLIILCITPAAVFDTGFQMSFLATLAIIICLNNYRVPGTWPRPIRFFTQIFLATLSSQLVLLPIFTNVFYQVSVTGLLSNMILVPWASLLMGLSFGYYILTLVHSGIVLYYPCLWGLEAFQKSVEFFASFRFSALPATAWNAGSIVAYYLFLFWVSQLPHRSFSRRIFLPCFGLAVLSLGIGFYWQNRPKAYLLNEWNHRAAIIRINHKTAVVFNDKISEEKLQRALYALGLNRAELAVSFSAEDNPPALLAKQVALPFEDLWPGEAIDLSGATVRVMWERRLTQDGRVYEDRGYSGKTQSGLSYCVKTGEHEICVGDHARFLQLPDGKILHSFLNRTINSFW